MFFNVPMHVYQRCTLKNMGWPGYEASSTEKYYVYHNNNYYYINNNQIRREVAVNPHCSNKHHECTHIYAVKVVIFADGFPKPMIIHTDKDLTNNDVPIREIPCQ